MYIYKLLGGWIVVIAALQERSKAKNKMYFFTWVIVAITAKSAKTRNMVLSFVKMEPNWSFGQKSYDEQFLVAKLANKNCLYSKNYADIKMLKNI
jgi:hypothetical protein